MRVSQCVECTTFSCHDVKHECYFVPDVAINYIAQRAGEKRVIPAGSTYKLRGHPYYFRGMRVFPSYLQAGPSFFIEESKRRMIAEDIAAAMPLAS